MKKQERMSPEQRDVYQILLKEMENWGEEAIPTRQILQLALQLDEKGEFYKFIEVFGDSRIDDKDVLDMIFAIVSSFIFLVIGLYVGAFALSKDDIVRENGIYKELLAEQEEVNKQIKAYNEILKQHNNYLMNFYNISRGL
nr:MAG TPA: copper transport outer membrane protein [Caudoviricetes sp.]